MVVGWGGGGGEGGRCSISVFCVAVSALQIGIQRKKKKEKAVRSFPPSKLINYIAAITARTKTVTNALPRNASSDPGCPRQRALRVSPQRTPRPGGPGGFVRCGENPGGLLRASRIWHHGEVCVAASYIALSLLFVLFRVYFMARCVLLLRSSFAPICLCFAYILNASKLFRSYR